MTINDILWIIGILAIIAGSAYIAVVGVGICVMVFNLWRDRREK